MSDILYQYIRGCAVKYKEFITSNLHITRDPLRLHIRIKRTYHSLTLIVLMWRIG